jgi:N6-adenosine-specific RNA methylase IME4
MSFVAIAADPPWAPADQLPGPKRGSSKHYDTMTVDEICEFNVPPTEPRAFLFLWRLSSMVEEAYRVARAWGFRPHSEIVWEKLTKSGKDHFGMGRIVRGSHETCIIAVKGKRLPKVHDLSVRSRFAAPVGEHSEKPDEFYRIARRLVGPGPTAELFARKYRDGWTCYGNELM